MILIVRKVERMPTKRTFQKSVLLLGIIIFLTCSLAQELSWPLVRQGDTGILVQVVQRLLAHQGHALEVDGAFGGGTRQNVVDFQSGQDLAADGVVGEDTWLALIVSLEEGASGEAVKALQEALNSTYSYSIDVDGSFGPATLAAVVDFQALLGLEADGIVGPNTWKALVSPEAQSALLAASVTVPLTPECLQVSDWTDLVAFRPDGAAVRAADQVGFVQYLEEARGDLVNFDQYRVNVIRPPTINGSQLAARSFLAYMRANLNMFYDTKLAVFEPYNEGDTTFIGDEPLSALVHIDMLTDWPWPINNPDDGSVVVSYYDGLRWRFSTIWTYGDGFHPVSGTREFGVLDNGSGGFIVYTRGADRPTTYADTVLSDTIFTSADALWRSFQKNTAEFVVENGGEAELEEPIVGQFEWEKARGCF